MVVIGYAGRSTGPHRNERCIVILFVTQLGILVFAPNFLITFIGIVERVETFHQMTDTHPVFQASNPTYCSCLETKMAASATDTKVSGDGDYATGGLIEGNFDVESLLAQLTIAEKASLLSGIVATFSEPLEIVLNHSM